MLAYWPSRSKALAVSEVGHTADFIRFINWLKGELNIIATLQIKSFIIIIITSIK